MPGCRHTAGACGHRGAETLFCETRSSPGWRHDVARAAEGAADGTPGHGECTTDDSSHCGSGRHRSQSLAQPTFGTPDRLDAGARRASRCTTTDGRTQWRSGRSSRCGRRSASTTNGRSRTTRDERTRDGAAQFRQRRRPGMVEPESFLVRLQFLARLGEATTAGDDGRPDAGDLISEAERRALCCRAEEITPADPAAVTPFPGFALKERTDARRRLE